MKYIKKTPIWIILLISCIGILILIFCKIILFDNNIPIGDRVPLNNNRRDIGLNEYYLVLVISLAIFFISFLGTVNSVLSRENILNNVIRAKIYSLINSQPGIHFSQIVRTLNLGNGQTSWHLSHLKRYELIRQVKSDQYLLFFSNVDFSKNETLSNHSTVFKSETRKCIFKLITNESAITQKQIRKQLQLSQSSIAYHLGILEQEDLIYSIRENRIRYYYLNEKHEKIQSDNSIMIEIRSLENG